jgi:hypothetical protein
MISILESHKIDLGLVPQDFFKTDQLPLKKDALELKTWFASQFGNTAIPIIDVWDSQCALAWLIFDESGSNYHVERCTAEDQARLGISDNMLYDALEDWGGSLSRSGYYPINATIRYKLA